MDAGFDILQPIAARAWPAERAAQIGGWRLHAANGFSGRANCCWPLAAPDRPEDEAIAQVEAWYADKGLPALFIMPEVEPLEPLRRRLEARGYRPIKPTLVMAGPLSEGDFAQVRVSDQVDDGFQALFAQVQGDPADAAERIGTLQRIAQPRAFASVLDHDEAGVRTVAIGASAVEGDWAGIFGMRTAPDHRRRGLARAVIAALADAARAAGARRAYLQVEADNAPAIILYRALGFETAYRYRYWTRG